MPDGRPSEAEYAPYYGRYVSLVPEGDVLRALESRDEIRRVASLVPPEREGYRYAPEKWSIRQVVGHLVDGERVFGYRAFCIARGEQAPLPAFDEQTYVARSPYEAIPLAELVAELLAMRELNLVFLRRLSPSAWTETGTASGKAVSVRALAYIMAGHVRHHIGILHQRYDLG